MGTFGYRLSGLHRAKSYDKAKPSDLLLWCDLTRDTFSFRLKFIFGSCAVPALDLVDQRSVTRVTSPSGRTAYQVHAPLQSHFLMVSS